MGEGPRDERHMLRGMGKFGQRRKGTGLAGGRGTQNCVNFVHGGLEGMRSGRRGRGLAWGHEGERVRGRVGKRGGEVVMECITRCVWASALAGRRRRGGGFGEGKKEKKKKKEEEGGVVVRWVHL